MEPVAVDFFTLSFGFTEINGDYEETQRRLLEMATFTSRPDGFEEVNFSVGGRVAQGGSFAMVSVAKLRELVNRDMERLGKSVQDYASNYPLLKSSIYTGSQRVDDVPYGKVQVFTVAANVGELQGEHTAANAIIQAASQWNALEFFDPDTTPERCVRYYEHDRTQGPACAAGGGYGTAYRNYLVPFPQPDGTVLRGQRADRQLNGAADAIAFIERETGVSVADVRNGYTYSTPERLAAFADQLKADPSLADKIIDRIEVGIQLDTEMTFPPSTHHWYERVRHQWTFERDIADTWTFSQVYASAVSVGYSGITAEDWAPFAKLVQRAIYQGTMLAALLHILRYIERNAEQLQTAPGAVPACGPVVLTRVGGGVFGNPGEWIDEAINEALAMTENYGIPLAVLHVTR